MRSEKFQIVRVTDIGDHLTRSPDVLILATDDEVKFAKRFRRLIPGEYVVRTRQSKKNDAVQVFNTAAFVIGRDPLSGKKPIEVVTVQIGDATRRNTKSAK